MRHAEETRSYSLGGWRPCTEDTIAYLRKDAALMLRHGDSFHCPGAVVVILGRLGGLAERP